MKLNVLNKLSLEKDLDLLVLVIKYKNGTPNKYLTINLDEVTDTVLGRLVYYFIQTVNNRMSTFKDVKPFDIAYTFIDFSDRLAVKIKKFKKMQNLKNPFKEQEILKQIIQSHLVTVSYPSGALKQKPKFIDKFYLLRRSNEYQFIK